MTLDKAPNQIEVGGGKDQLDELFGSSSEEENVMDIDKPEFSSPEKDSIDQDMESTLDSEAERQKEISKALFGDDDSEESSASSVEDVSLAKKRKARNILGRKEITLEECPKLETAGLKVYYLISLCRGYI
jgi:hypothetical protein